MKKFIAFFILTFPSLLSADGHLGGGGGAGAVPVPPAAAREETVIYEGLQGTLDGQVLNLVNRFGNRRVEVQPGSVPINFREAQSRGFFRRVQYLHRTGWKFYSLGESFLILQALEAHSAGGADTLGMNSGGKLGRPYTIRFKANPGFAEAHDGEQFSPSSGNLRPIRCVWFNPETVVAKSKEGWTLIYGSLPAGFVCNIHDSMSGDELTFAQAQNILIESIEQNERSSSLEGKGEWDSEALKYFPKNEYILNALAVQPADQNLVVWEWDHGRKGNNGWKAFPAADSALLEQRFNEGQESALLNGGKETTRPLKVTFNTRRMSKNGRGLCFHSQYSYHSQTYRCVRRTVKIRNCKDFIYYSWLNEFDRVSAIDAYKIYTQFLERISLAPTDVRASEAIARAELAALQAQSRWCAPEQTAPEDFQCMISLALMEDPVYVVGSPQRKFERKVLEKWLETNPTHPVTRLPVSPENIITDDETRERIMTWMRSFLLPDPAETTAAAEEEEEEEEVLPMVQVGGGGGAAAEEEVLPYGGDLSAAIAANDPEAIRRILGQ